MKSFARLAVFLTLFQCAPAAAQVRPMLSGALIYAKTNELDVQNKIEPSFAYGAIAKKNNIIATIQTNRMIEQTSHRKTRNGLISRSKATSDSFLVGYAFDKFAPSLLLSRTEIRKQLEMDGRIVADRTSMAILRGVNFTYFFSKHISASAFYVLPNHHLRLEGAGGTSLNLIF